MKVNLVVERGRTSVSKITLRKLPTTVGRHRSCRLQITSRQVSREHCIFDEQEGLLTVRDLGSSNGTLVNGQRVSMETVLEPGDRVEIGPVLFRVDYEPVEMVTAPALLDDGDEPVEAEASTTFSDNGDDFPEGEVLTAFSDDAEEPMFTLDDLATSPTGSNGQESEDSDIGLPREHLTMTEGEVPLEVERLTFAEPAAPSLDATHLDHGDLITQFGGAGEESGDNLVEKTLTERPRTAPTGEVDPGHTLFEQVVDAEKVEDENDFRQTMFEPATGEMGTIAELFSTVPSKDEDGDIPRTFFDEIANDEPPMTLFEQSDEEK